MAKDGVWVQLPNDGSQKPTYSFEPHSFNKTMCGKKVCGNCGLMRLNNDFTNWSVKMGCKNDLHPAYQNKRRTTNSCGAR